MNKYLIIILKGWWSSGMIFRLGRKGRGFDSCNVPIGVVAQLVERMIPDHKVRGSSPFDLTS